MLQKNFQPVNEIGEQVEVTCIEGEIPADFPEAFTLEMVQTHPLNF